MFQTAEVAIPKALFADILLIIKLPLPVHCQRKALERPTKQF
jgi:hypothetical protein